MSERSGYQVVRPAKPPLAPVTRLAKITGKAGTTPPYLYTGEEVVHDGAGFASADFDGVTGGVDLGWNLVNVQEIGDSGGGVNALEDGSIVAFWPMPGSTYFMCTASHYKGTY